MNGIAPVAFGAELVVTWDELRGQSFILRMLLTRAGLRREVLLPRTLSLASGSGDCQGGTAPGYRRAHRGQEPWEKKGGLVQPRGDPICRAVGWKPSVVTVTLCSVSTGSWDQTHVVGGSSWGGGSKSLSQMLDRLSFRLARATHGCPGRAGQVLPALTVRTVCHCGGDSLALLAQGGQLLQ